ncbi:MAG: hypothetical protein ACTSWQ_07020 [Candidatus Thorarchaeota archaeon]
MARICTILLIFILTLATVSAIKVGVVVDYPDDATYTECVEVPDGSSAAYVLDQSQLSIQYSAYAFGSFIEEIDNVGSDGDGEYWFFWNDDDKSGSYDYATVGVDDYDINNEITVIAFHYGTADPATNESEGNAEYIDYDTICAESTNKLVITEVDVEIDGEDDRGLLEDETIDVKVVPGSEFEITIYFESLFADGPDIEDIEIVVTIEDINDGSDLEKDINELDLRPDSDDEVTFTFDIPNELDDDDYRIEITIEGEDEDGVDYFDQWKLILEADNEEPDMRILEVDFDPSEGIACDRDLRVDVTLENRGNRDEEVKLFVENEELGVTTYETLTVDQGTDNDETERFDIELPDSIASGYYTFNIRAELRGDEEVTSTFRLKVGSCSKYDEPTPTPTPTPKTNAKQDIIDSLAQRQQDLKDAEAEEATPTPEPLIDNQPVETVKVEKTPRKASPLIGLFIVFAVMLGGLALFYHAMKGRL